jgi:nickel/cobalt exporter
MQEMIALQRWLHEGMAQGLGKLDGGNPLAIGAAMAAAVLFGMVHALMPGHGKTVLFSYHLGRQDNLPSSIANGAVLALTHVGIALVLVLAGFAVISKAFAMGGRTPQFETASGVLIAVIGAFLVWRAAADRPAHSRDGRTLAFVTGLVPCPLTTFIMSYALARGLLAAGLAVTAAMAVGMVATIAAVAVLATLLRGKFLTRFARTEALRARLGQVLEVGGAVLVLAFGIWLVINVPA